LTFFPALKITQVEASRHIISGLKKFKALLSQNSVRDQKGGKSEQNRSEILYPKRAIILNEKGGRKHLIVSDLHIGFEEKFRAGGIAIRPSIEKITSELQALIEQHKITDLLINGDVKSGTDRITKYEWDNVPKFFEKMTGFCRVAVIPGNHDGGLQHLLPASVTLHDSNGITISNILILHGHTRPLAKFQNCKKMIMGHIHPIFQKRGSPLSGQPVWIFLRANRSEIFKNAIALDESLGTSPDLEIILMPSFNMDLVVAGFALDAARQERKIAPVLRDLKNVREAMISTIGGDLIGDASTLEYIL
jgi:putative SbcD/Mre11-related phosphoesterase